LASRGWTHVNDRQASISTTTAADTICQRLTTHRF